MSWQTECVIILRNCIDDLASPPTYSDARLQQLVTVSAREVLTQADFDVTYTVDIGAGTISPDPTDAPRDEYFITLITLKAICILAKSTARTASGQAMTLSDHFSSINLGGIYQSKSNDAKSACDSYKEALVQYQIGQLIPGRIITSPYNIHGNYLHRDQRSGDYIIGG